jgi:2-polyprenyl-6-hydroxyphenyl methylase/3-demethylubiquinone-9 3-methyltransferase
VLELGCGYGRILPRLFESCAEVIGLDTSLESLRYGRDVLPDIQFIQMDAGTTGFRRNSFDVVVCIQNGISAFKVEPVKLVSESLRIVKSGGKCIFSTYSDKIWKERVRWFQLQAEEGLLGEIDWDQTKRGTIVCRDGFIATTFSENEFYKIADDLEVSCETREVDASSLFAIFKRF